MKQEVSGADYKAALQEFGNQRDERHEAVAKVERQRKNVSKRRRLVGFGGLAATFALVAVVGVPNTFAMFKSERPYALGPVGEAEDDTDGLDIAVQGLWEVRRELDLYRYHNGGRLPNRLKELDKAPQECPGCGKAWTYKRSGKSYRIGCPDPRKHGRAAIVIDDRVGPPSVQLDAGKGDVK